MLTNIFTTFLRQRDNYQLPRVILTLKMKRFSPVVMTALVFLSASPSIAYSEIIDLTPDQMTPDTFNPAKVLVTANRLIALGEKNANASLLKFAISPPDPHGIMAGENRDYYTDWLCLLIYDPKSASSLPWPMLGGPNFPYEGVYKGKQLAWMNTADWPRFPLALSRSVPFLVALGYYMLGGEEEPGQYFLVRCQASGVFHEQPYPIPTHAEAQAALDELLSSPPWKALDWHESNDPDYLHANQNREINFLRQQVERMK